LPELICNTSPLQYLHQLGVLHILPALVPRVVVPPAVVDELSAGLAQGIVLPDPRALDWIAIRTPASAPVLALVTDLGPGETQVIALALESGDAVAVLDDALARRVAETLGVRLTGTLGLLLDAKRARLIPAVTPLLDQLESLRFRLAAHTRAAVLALAGESS
jgi:predicted nucleic acid-binding protein